MTSIPTLATTRLPVPKRRTIRTATLVVAAEVLVVVAYLSVTTTTITQPRYALYPFVWINLGVWAVVRTDTRIRDRRGWAIAVAITGLYLLGLLYAGGLIRFGGFAGLEPLDPVTALLVRWDLPGWGPLVVYRSPWLRAVVIPFKLVGYVSLSYLVYARLLDATRVVLSGVFGLVSCVGCTFSILLPLAGASALFGSALTDLSWDFSTVVFVLTVALLYWGEGIERFVGEYVRTHT